MRKRTFGTITLALLITLGVAACGSSPSTSPSAGLTTMSAASPSGGGSANQSAIASIKGFAFSPDPIAVAVGGTVTWTNNDSTAHTVTFDDASVVSSSNLDPGATFSATFPKAGSYTYHCKIHPSMQGTVTVS